jgi:hypothetical protein
MEFLTRRQPDTAWGPWRLDERTNTIVCELKDVRSEYWIPLRETRTNVQCANWLAQVAEKRWATDAILAGLVRAFGCRLRPGAGGGGS